MKAMDNNKPEDFYCAHTIGYLRGTDRVCIICSEGMKEAIAPGCVSPNMCKESFFSRVKEWVRRKIFGGWIV